MTTPSRYAVPLADLERVRVPGAEQVQEQGEVAVREPYLWQPVPAAHGGGGDADGD